MQAHAVPGCYECCARRHITIASCRCLAFKTPARGRQQPGSRHNSRDGALACLRAAPSARGTAINATHTCPQPPALHTLVPAEARAYDEFLVLWLDRRRSLSLGRPVAGWVLEDVEAGLLPCDAELLFGRVRAVQQLGKQHHSINTQRLLNQERTTLHHASSLLADAMRRLPVLLPRGDPTQLLAALLPELSGWPLELLAARYGEWDLAYQSAAGAQLPGPLFSHLLRHGLAAGGGAAPLLPPESAAAVAAAWGPAPLLASEAAAAQALQPPAATEPRGGAAAPAPATVGMLELVEALQGVVGVLGPELAHVALAAVPQLLTVAPGQLLARLAWMQRVLRLRKVEALLVAELHAGALLLDCEQLERSHTALGEQLVTWTEWPERVVTGFLRREPGLLALPLEALQARWMAVAWCADARPEWAREWRARKPGGAAAALNAAPAQLARLEYVAATGELPLLSLPRVLYLPLVDFFTACPGYRGWRLQQAGAVPTWRAGATSSSGGDAAPQRHAHGSSGSVAAAVAAAGGVRAPGSAEHLVQLLPIESVAEWEGELPPGWA